MIQYSIHLPRLCDRTTLREIARLHPTRLSVTEQETPLSTAQMELPAEDQEVTVGQFVELYDAHASLGYYRVSEVHRTYRAGVMQTVYLEHGLATLANDVVFGGVTYNKDAQTAKAVLNSLLGKQTIRYWTLWDDGSVDAAYLDQQKDEFYFENQDLLEAILDFMATLPRDLYLCWDMSTFPWRLIPRAFPATATSEARLSRNVESLRIGYDWNSLCTRLYPIGGGGEDALTIEGAAGNTTGRLYIDSDTQNAWGVISQIWQDSDSTTADALYNKAKKHLEEVKNPVVSITMEGHDLSGLTGEPLDSFECGRPCRVLIPEEGISMSLRILTIEHKDLITDPARVTLTIGTAEKRKASRQKREESRGGGGGGGSRSTKEQITRTATKNYGTDTAGVSFQVGSEWTKIDSITVSITDNSAYGFVLYADNNWVGTINGDKTLSLTSYLRHNASGEVSRASHSLRISGDPDESYTVRFVLTIVGKRSTEE